MACSREKPARQQERGGERGEMGEGEARGERGERKGREGGERGEGVKQGQLFKLDGPHQISVYISTTYILHYMTCLLTEG